MVPPLQGMDTQRERVPSAHSPTEGLYSPGIHDHGLVSHGEAVAELSHLSARKTCTALGWVLQTQRKLALRTLGMAAMAAASGSRASARRLGAASFAAQSSPPPPIPACSAAKRMNLRASSSQMAGTVRTHLRGVMKIGGVSPWSSNKIRV